jgi:hypothetical protein
MNRKYVVGKRQFVEEKNQFWFGLVTIGLEMMTVQFPMIEETYFLDYCKIWQHFARFNRILDEYAVSTGP